MGLRGSEQRLGGRSVKEVRVCISSLSRGRYRAVVPLAEMQERGSKGLCEGVHATTLSLSGVALMRQVRGDQENPFRPTQAKGSAGVQGSLAM
jgi:hypothetical protein